MAGPFNLGEINQEELLGVGVPRYLYAMRRTDDGELYVNRFDQLSNTDSITINQNGTTDGNYDQFETGVDFFEGRDVNHELVYDNLNYEQYRWDGRSLWYYINDDGELVVRINGTYSYPSGI